MADDGIYIVENETTKERWVVIASSASDAAASVPDEPDAVEVGRIGTYDPGINGARMTIAQSRILGRRERP
jgi:hypothetical protein